MSAAATAANAVSAAMLKLFPTSPASRAAEVVSCQLSRASSSAGNAKPNTTGAAQATNAATPHSAQLMKPCSARRGAVVRGAPPIRALEREEQHDEGEKACRELRGRYAVAHRSHALKMPVVKTSTPKYDTVPKSASVSMSASALPATMAGRASGTRRG